MRTAVLSWVVFFCGAFSSPADAPKVVATQPRNGGQNVSASVAELVITFDQDMDPSGFSLLGGGPTFPKITGRPAWRTAREFVVAIQLQPGQTIRIGINSATKANFKNRRGVSATPSFLAFKVAGPGDPPPAMTDAGLRQSIEQLRDALDHYYSYREVHVVDWAAAWKQFEPRLMAAESAREFAIVAGEMLAGTQDPHIWLSEGGEIVPAFRRVATPNANVQLLPKLIAGWTQKHPMVAVGKAAPGIGYMAIHSWEKQHASQLLEAAMSALMECRELPALIVDVRFNSGGDESIAREFAGCFLRARSAYARHRNLDPSSPAGFAPAATRWIEPTPNRPAYAGRIAVLMGPVNMSSAEAFLLMMKQASNCKLVGERSYGASGNPQPHLLANGVTVFLPSWQAMLPDGTVLEKKGIEPDVRVEAGADDLETGDPVLEKAIELLKQ